MNRKEIQKLIVSLVIFAVALTIIIISAIGMKEAVSIDQEQVKYQKAVVPSTELIDVRTREAEILNSYAVLAPDIHRIPVDRAIELMVEEIEQ